MDAHPATAATDRPASREAETSSQAGTAWPGYPLISAAVARFSVGLCRCLWLGLEAVVA
jgi:hypothetical protein